MKKILLATTLLAIFAFAHQTTAQSIGIKAGMNITNTLMKDNDDSADNNSKIGFQIGAIAELPLGGVFAIEPGILFSTRGYKNEFTEDGVDVENTINLNYIDIPVLARLGFGAGGVEIFVHGGPNIGYGLSGKSKTDLSGGGTTVTVEEDISFGGDEEDDDAKALDLGLLVGAGIGFGALEVGLDYNLGLSNLSHFTENGNKVKNRVFAVTAAYKFGK